MPHRSAVITGLGTVSALGVGAPALWDALTQGRSGLSPLTRFNPAGFSTHLAGQASDFSAKDHVPKHYRKAVKVMARDTELAVGAAKLAVEDAGLVTRAAAPEGSDLPTTYPPGRVGCQIGAGLIATEIDELSSAFATAAPDGSFSLPAWGESGLNNLQPLWMLKYLPNMLACHVTIIHGTEGPSNTITCAQASGLLSIGEAARVIERDAADACLAGGAESKLNLMGYLRTEFAGHLAPLSASTPGATAVAPFDPATKGGVLGEAGGIIILEESAQAAARGAKVYANFLGFGAAQSTSSIYRTAAERGPSSNVPADPGLELAIARALHDAHLAPADIDAIIPQGSAIREEDAAEIGALAAVFGSRLSSIPLITLSPYIGNCWAGSGSLAVATAALALKHQTLPARLNAGTPANGLNAAPAPSRPHPLRNILVCTSSQGGQNAAVVLGRA